MFARDANNSTWYVLRYTADFVPRGGSAGPSFPRIGPELFYDPDRHVLELLPKKPPGETAPLAGIAVDVDGEIYRVDPASDRLLVRRCDGSEAEVLCERDVFATPTGLALDRRGFLYVADPLAERVVVILPDDGSVMGVLVEGLQEPVDVAVAPNGRIYVADRAAGRIVVFTSRFERCGDFATRDAENLPVTPKPITVMIDPDGAILVADAAHPRLLRFGPNGEPLADVELHALVQSLPGGAGALDALEKAYGHRASRFLSGACGPCRPSNDGGERLAEIHRALRLVLLRLQHRFEDCGTFVSAVLDGGTPGIEWHKIEIDADTPDGTWLKIQTATAEVPGDLDPSALTPPAHFAPFEDVTTCAVKPLAPWDIPDRLVQSPAGRYLRLRVVLGSDGTATPSVRSIRIFYPRVSYLELLPRVYRRDAEGAQFLEHFLALFEHILTGVEDRYELFSRELNPDAAPLEVINWLACLIDLAFDPSWPLDRRRALVAAAMDLYRTRGTVKGLVRYVEIYTGMEPVIIEGFLERPEQPPLLGVRGHILGSTTNLAATMASVAPEDLLLGRYAHRFTVVVYVEDDCDESVLLSVVNRIVDSNKPAHTIHSLRIVRPDARVGATQVGLDLMLGGRSAPHTQIGGCPEPGAPTQPPAVLGLNSVLGERRPQYVRQLLTRL